jgi:hypothetical protein
MKMRNQRTFFEAGEFDSPPSGSAPVQLPDFVQSIRAATVDPDVSLQIRLVSIELDVPKPLRFILEWFPINTPISQIREFLYAIGAVIPGDERLKILWLTHPGQSLRPTVTEQQLQPTETLADVLQKKGRRTPETDDPEAQVIHLMASVANR